MQIADYIYSEEDDQVYPEYSEGVVDESMEETIMMMTSNETVSDKKEIDQKLNKLEQEVTKYLQERQDEREKQWKLFEERKLDSVEDITIKMWHILEEINEDYQGKLQLKMKQPQMIQRA